MSKPPVTDPRRRIPRTDALLALPAVSAARARLGDTAIRDIIRQAQDAARRGETPPDDVERIVVESVSASYASSIRPVLNATGVVVHTNLGRAPLSPAALDAVGAASGYVDVELDLESGTRSKRGTGS